MATRKSRPLKINTILEDVLEKAGLSGALEEKKIREAWPMLVGKRVAEIAVIEELRNDRLVLKIENSTWKMELNYQKEAIVEKVNAFMGWNLVKSVILR